MLYSFKTVNMRKSHVPQNARSLGLPASVRCGSRAAVRAAVIDRLYQTRIDPLTRDVMSITRVGARISDGYGNLIVCSVF